MRVQIHGTTVVLSCQTHELGVMKQKLRHSKVHYRSYGNELHLFDLDAGTRKVITMQLATQKPSSYCS